MKTIAPLTFRLVLLAAGLGLTPGQAAEPAAAVQIYEDTAKGFSFDVPAGWTVSKSGESLLVNNQRPGLNITYWKSIPMAGAGPIRSPDKSPEEILQLLQPGEIWIKLTASPGSNREPDSAGSDIKARLASPMAPTANPDLFRLSFSFYKHGHWFDGIAFLRAPASDDEKGKLRTMLQNLRFKDSPVSNEIWAVSLARQSLPAAVRDVKEQPLQGRPDRRPPPIVAWSAQSVEDAYLIAFTLNAVPPEADPAYKAGDTWRFLVARDGTVTPQRMPTSSPAAKPPN